MKKFWMLTCMSLAVSLGVASAAVETTPFRLEETRSKSLQPDTVGRQPDGLKLVLSLKGPEVDASAKYGKLKLEEAVDDKGTTLIPKEDRFGEEEKLKEFSNQFFRKFDFDNKRPAAAPQIEINLAAAARAATKIAHIKGEFVLVSAGDVKTIEVKGQSAAGDIKLDIPKEAAFGLTLTVKAKSTDLGLTMTGDETALESLEVLDDKGNKISFGMSSMTMGGVKSQSMGLQKPLDETMKVVAKVAMNRKTTKVPLDLKDIALP